MSRFNRRITTGGIVLLLSCALRVIYQLFYFSLGNDKTFQILGAKNLLNGHGLTMNGLLAADLQQEIFVPLVLWPPGYSLIVAPFIVFLKGDYFTAALLVDCITAIAFVIYARKIVSLLDMPGWAVNFFTVVAGGFTYSFIYTTDFIGVTGFLATFYYSLKILNGNTSRAVLIKFGIAILITSVLRYAYIPLEAFMPFYIWLNGKLNGAKKISIAGQHLLLWFIYVTIALFLFQTFYTGAPVAVMDTGKGFYPGNLIHFYPFLFSFFTDLDLLYMTLHNYTGIEYGLIQRSFVFLHLFVFAFVVIVGVLTLSGKKIRLPSGIQQHFFILGIAGSAITIGILAYLSLRWNPVVDPWKTWTYVSEARYYAPVTIWLQMAAFLYLSKNNRITKLGWVIIIFFSVRLLHDLYRILKPDNTTSFVFRHMSKDMGDVTKVMAIAQATKKADSSDREVVIAATRRQIMNFAKLEGLSVFRDDAYLLSTDTIKTRRNATMIFAVEKVKLPFYQQMINLPGARHIGSGNYIEIYRIDYPANMK